MGASESHLIVFADLETTGLLDSDPFILEVAMAVFDTASQKVVGRYHRVTQPLTCDEMLMPGSDRLALVQSRLSAPYLDEYVLGMHTETGLITEVLNAPEYVNPQMIDIDAAEWLADMRLGTDRKIFLGGSGVSEYDRPLLLRDMGRLESHMEYRTLELGSVRRLLKMFGMPIPDSPPFHTPIHRAMDDVNQSLEQFKWMQRYLRCDWKEATA